MSLINELISKQADLFIGVLSGVIVTLFTELMKFITNRRTQQSNIESDKKVVNNVEYFKIEHIYQSYISKNGKNRELEILLLFVSCVIALFYLYRRQEVLAALNISLSFLSGFLIVLSLYLRRIKFIPLKESVFVAVLSLMLFIGSNYLVSEARQPHITAENFIYIEQILHRYGVTSLLDYFNANEIFLISLHSLGVSIFMYVPIGVLSAFVYYCSMTNHILMNSSENIPLIARKTAKYRSIPKQLFFNLAFMIISYYLISGKFFIWLIYELPHNFDSFLNYVLNGVG